jgi:hypothetical protein
MKPLVHGNITFLNNVSAKKIFLLSLAYLCDQALKTSSCGTSTTRVPFQLSRPTKCMLRWSDDWQYDRKDKALTLPL